MRRINSLSDMNFVRRFEKQLLEAIQGLVTMIEKKRKTGLCGSKKAWSEGVSR
jgi:hypothetical protein